MTLPVGLTELGHFGITPEELEAEVARQLRAQKCVHFEGGELFYDGPGSSSATHYLLPDHNGDYVPRLTLFPVPSASSPALNW